MAGLQCYIGNCTSMEECRRPELVTDCPHDQAYDACLSIIVQKGRLFHSCCLIHLFKRCRSSFSTKVDSSPIKIYINILAHPPYIKFADRIIVNLVIVEISPEV